MVIHPIHIEQYGPGIDLSHPPQGFAIRMADPVEDLTYARNTVTLVYRIADYEHLRLSFAAMEFGDEPHAPPPSPFGDDVDFDGVAISIDGAAWYEIQDLRNLRCDAFTEYNIDLDAAAAQWGLPLDAELRIRFCQYDNNPAPMDGIFLHGIQLTGDLTGPVLHLPMDDNDNTPTVRDISGNECSQVFIDPSGDANTAAHSVPGPNGATGLFFDGIDDRIDFGTQLMGDVVGANRDFTIALWLKVDTDPGVDTKTFFLRGGAATDPRIKLSMTSGRVSWMVHWGDGAVYPQSQSGMFNSQWRHMGFRRQGQTLSLWVDGTLHSSKTHPDYAKNLFGPWSPRAIGQVYSSQDSWPLALADFRVYSRALREEEIAAFRTD